MNEIWTILIGAAPITEVRGAIPIAVGVFGFSPLKAYFLSVFGNILPIVPVLWCLDSVSKYLSHHFYFFNRFFAWLFSRTRRLNEDKFGVKSMAWVSLALFIFVAIPLPLTGVWSGIAVAFVFGLPFWRSVLAISLGSAVAGLIVLAAVLGVIQVGVFIGN